MVKNQESVRLFFVCCLVTILISLISGCSMKENEKKAPIEKSEVVKEATDYQSEKKLNEKRPVMKRTYEYYDVNNFDFLKDKTKKDGLLEISEEDMLKKMRNKGSFRIIFWTKEADYRLLFTDEYLKEKKEKAYFYHLPEGFSTYNVTPTIAKISIENNKQQKLKNVMKYESLDTTFADNTLAYVKKGVMMKPIFTDYKQETRMEPSDFTDNFSGDREKWVVKLNNWITEFHK